MERYVYPRVAVNTTAINRRPVIIDREDTRSLFVAFKSPKGPSGILTRVFTLEQFVQTFGDLDYDTQGQTALNIANWLVAGGTIYAYRLVSGTTSVNGLETAKYVNFHLDEDGITEIVDLSFEAKYKGELYNQNKIRIDVTGQTLNISVINTAVSRFPLESYTRVTLDNMTRLIASSQYIKNIFMSKEYYDSFISAKTSTTFGYKTGVDPDEYTATERMTEYVETVGSFDDYVKSFYVGATDTVPSLIPFDAYAIDVLDNYLENRAQLVMDAGYSVETKKAMYDVVTSLERDDMHLVIDLLVNPMAGTIYTGGKPTDVLVGSGAGSLNIEYNTDGLFSIRADQPILVNESLRDGDHTWVTSTYYLSRLYPVVPIQLPVAGTTRGTLLGVQDLGKTFSTSATKDAAARRKYNYIEKDSRGYHFMYQRTFDRENDGSVDGDVRSPLSFINNVFVKNKMIQDLQDIGRKYLFEFNDAGDDGTLTNMETEMNKYIAQWINTRVLSEGAVSIEPGASIEEIQVYVTMKFVGTIEFISFNVTLD